MLETGFGTRRSWSVEKIHGIDSNSLEKMKEVMKFDFNENRHILEETKNKMNEEAHLLKGYYESRELGQDRSLIKTLVKVVDFWIKNRIKRGEGLERLDAALYKYEKAGEAEFKVIPELKKAFELRNILREEKKNFTKDDYYLTIVEQFQKQNENYRNTFKNPTPDQITYWKQIDSIKSEMEMNALKKGQPMIHFRIQTEEGKVLDSREMLKRGPLVLSFFVGSFCPYCINEMCVLTDSVSRIHAMGANLVSLGPDHSALRYFRKLGVIGDIGLDKDLVIANQYKLVYNMTKEVTDFYKKCGCVVPGFNFNDKWCVPMPATYVIDQNGMVVYDFVHIEYYKRADPSEFLEVLTDLLRKRVGVEHSTILGKRKFEDENNTSDRQEKLKKLKTFDYTDVLALFADVL